MVQCLVCVCEWEGVRVSFHKQDPVLTRLSCSQSRSRFGQTTHAPSALSKHTQTRSVSLCRKHTHITNYHLWIPSSNDPLKGALARIRSTPLSVLRTEREVVRQGSLESQMWSTRSTPPYRKWSGINVSYCFTISEKPDRPLMFGRASILVGYHWQLLAESNEQPLSLKSTQIHQTDVTQDYLLKASF